jgi:hypothetical protein
MNLYVPDVQSKKYAASFTGIKTIFWREMVFLGFVSLFIFMTDYEFDDEWDACENCGGVEFEANDREWERVCMDCGMTSCYEWFNYTKATPAYFYKHENYFQNTIIANAISKGAPLNVIEEHLMLMFHKSLCLFHRVKRQIGRDNYPSYQYALLKLSEHLKVDVSPFIKLPKMKKTLEAVKRDWLLIDPCLND